VTPAALPILATISRVARIDRVGGGDEGFLADGLAVGLNEIQEVSVARITSVSGAVDFAERLGNWCVEGASGYIIFFGGACGIVRLTRSLPRRGG